ncbi:hypothetical protein [Kitasatospora sp. NPDC002040]|uniref:hypothetical protein n=1 Tax=Kitasatospora sp. NPDC002040 TaxID=3154661 RepID=UPI0033181D13
MLIPGYENDPLIPGEELLALPGFWATHLLLLAEGEDFEPEPTLFGADDADADAAYEQLFDSAAWPVIQLPVQNGHQILIIFCNHPDDSGVDYYLSHRDWDHLAPLASIDGHFSGPGLAWRELAHIAGHPGDGPGVTDRHARLLLLLPILGDADLPADTVMTVASALASIGTPAEARSGLAEAMLDHPFWDGETWYFEGAGSPLRGGATTSTSRVLRCAGSYSPRIVPLRLSLEQDIRLAEALGTAELPPAP